MRDRRREIRDSIIRSEFFSLPQISLFPLDPRIKESALSGGFGIFGNGGCGKTTFAYHIARELMKDEDIQLKVVDKAQNWIHEFDHILYQPIDYDTITEGKLYFDDQSIIFDIRKIVEPKLLRECVKNIVRLDYLYHQELKSEGLMDRHIIYVVEECQSILGSVGINSVWNTYITDGRNYNISFIFIGRRMAQLSAKVRGNLTSYIWGRTIESIDLKRIYDITGSETVVRLLPRLNRGQFLFYDGGKTFLIEPIPKFEPIGKPERWCN